MYEDDFESMSKSQVGLSMSRASLKRNLNAKSDLEVQDYSSDSESMDSSKKMSDALITCFLCKQQIQKSKALEHSKTCNHKPSKSSLRHSQTESVTKKQKYSSPIKELDQEDKSQYTSSEHYSSSRFEESSSRVASQSKLMIDKDKKSIDHLRESYMSSSMSTEKPIQNAFSKHVTDFMRQSNDKDEVSSSLSKSNDKNSAGGDGTIT